jgi:hypothetical protein
MKKVVKLNEKHLRKIISEATRRTLNEIDRGIGWNKRPVYANTWLGGWDNIPEALVAQGLVSPKFEDQLYDKLQDIFENIEVEGEFICGYESCDLESTNEEEFFEAIDEAFGKTPRIAEFVKKWTKNKLDSLTYDDFNPEDFWDDDDRDPLDFDERYN